MNARHVKIAIVLLVTAVLVGMTATGTTARNADGKGSVDQNGDVVIYTAPAQKELESSAAIDVENAVPMPLPTVNAPPPAPADEGVAGQSAGTPMVVPGSSGSGKTVQQSGEVAEGEACANSTAAAVGLDAPFEPQEFGASSHVFTTSRVDTDANGNVSRTYPYRAVGKLYFNKGTDTYVCSGSLIKPGVVVTAAHCVAEFGERRFYSNWRFYPGVYGDPSTTTPPYGAWTTQNAIIRSSYYYGTDPCYYSGVVCENDVAVLVLNPQNGVYPGANTGWLGYGWNRWGFNSSNLALINQLGYPVSHDTGYKMQRTDSEGFISSTYSGNTVWGGRMTGGSSGGPEVLNLGIRAVLNGIDYGTYSSPNIVVGVTSWGYVDSTIKQQGASPFTSNNIALLADTACSWYPAACQ